MKTSDGVDGYVGPGHGSACTGRSVRPSPLALAFPVLAFLLSYLFSAVALTATERSPQALEAGTWPLERFLIRPHIREVKLSPDGERLAFLLRHDEKGTSSAWWTAVGPTGEEGGEGIAETGPRIKLFESRVIESLHWSGDGRGLFVETGDRLGFAALDGSPPRWIFSFEKSEDAVFLGVDGKRLRHILIAEPTPEVAIEAPDRRGGRPAQAEEASEGDLGEKKHRLLRIDADGTVEVLFERDQPIRHALLDADGALRYLKRGEGLEQTILRLDGSSEPREILRCEALDSCSPLAFQDLGPADGKPRRERLWVVTHGGGDLRALYTIDLEWLGGDPGQAEGLAVGDPRLIHRDPDQLADLSSLVYDFETALPALVSYDSDRLRVYGVDRAREETMARLRRSLPGSRLEIESAGSTWLIEESAATLSHPRYYLFDSASDQPLEILGDLRHEVEGLPREALVEPQFLTFEASDGLPVHGLLYLPRGVDPASAPVVVRVHGGPWNHVRNRWSSLSQFLISRGYILYEPNFRSSTGFGRRHVRAAEGDFGDGRVQLDILEGLEDIHARGFGDPERVAIIGHSFGGFSTLGGLAFTPKRFVAGIASAPPIDLVRAIRDLPEDELQANGIPRREVLKVLVGDLEDPEVAAALRRRSPEARVAETERPLLMLAGGADPKVDIIDVKHYAGALRGLGRDVSFLVDETQGHSFEHDVSLGTYFFLVERFLGHHLGGSIVPSADDRLDRYLAHHLRFSGPSLEAALAKGR